MCRIQQRETFDPKWTLPDLTFKDWESLIESNAFEPNALDFGIIEANAIVPQEPIAADIPLVTLPVALPVAPLSPVSIKRKNSVDDVAEKRFKQAKASQKCRQKKQELLNNFQETITNLEQEKFDLTVQLAVLQNEIAASKRTVNAQEQRIKQLQDQLELAHQIILK